MRRPRARDVAVIRAKLSPESSLCPCQCWSGLLAELTKRAWRTITGSCARQDSGTFRAVRGSPFGRRALAHLLVVRFPFLNADQPVAVEVNFSKVLVGPQELTSRQVAIVVDVHLAEPERASAFLHRLWIGRAVALGHNDHVVEIVSAVGRSAPDAQFVLVRNLRPLQNAVPVPVQILQ